MKNTYTGLDNCVAHFCYKKAPVDLAVNSYFWEGFIFSVSKDSSDKNFFCIFCILC